MMRHEVRLHRASKSFTDAVYAILTAEGRWDGPLWLLSGLSGMAFKLSVHRQLLPMSVTAYGQWGTEHLPAIDNLGIHTVYDGGRTRHDTFTAYQKDAVNGVRDSLNEGMGVIYWVPEFGVIHGYDDVDRVFYVQDGRSPHSRVILYDNFGMNETPFWYVQTLGKQVDIPLKEQVLGSLRLACQDWDTPYKLLPDQDIASGRAAYTYLLNALRQGGYDGGGAGYVLQSYAASRLEIRDYLREMKSLLPALQEPGDLYAELCEGMSELIEAASVDVRTGQSSLNSSAILELAKAMERAREFENRGMAHIRILTERHPDPLQGILPRWGAHSPR